MKRKLALGLVSLFTLPIISTTGVALHAQSLTPESTESTTSQTPASATPAADDDAKAIAERIAQRKDLFKTKLSIVEKTRIKTKCKASQTILGTERDRVKVVETTRSELYARLIGNLNDLSTRLKAKNIDTTALNADIVILKNKVNTFNTDHTAYKQAISDIAGMDCAADPDGFRASLETARTSLKTVTDDAAAIRGYLKDTVRPLLQTIRAELAKTETTGTNTNTNNTTTTTGGSQ